MHPIAPGEAILEVARGGARSVVTRAAARSPVRLLLPRNHGHAVWTFVSSLGGGLVDGDHAALRVKVGAGAAALLTTQASTKVYRGDSRQRVEADVADGGLLVVVPDPVTCFAGASLEQATEVRLGAGASLILVDAVTCGRAARGERWQMARYRSSVTVHREGRLVLRDAVELDPAHGALAARIGRFDGLATVVAVGDDLAAPGPASDRDWVVARSRLGDGVTLVRAAATSAERLHRGVRSLLEALPKLLGDDPFSRKW
jgi:urease accessory protein